MDGKYYTFLICPGAHGKFHKFQLPARIVQLITAFAIAGIVTLGALANSYARMLLKVWNYNTVRAERDSLKGQCRSLRGAVARTNENLASLQSLASEVALTYSFSQGQHPQSPPTILRLATLGRAGSGSDYDASISAFKLMKARLLDSDASTALSAVVTSLVEDTASPSIWPVRGTITAGFGKRMDPLSGEGSFHAGIDIATPIGTPVGAAADGLVFQAGPEAGYGNVALINHGFGVTTKYAHLSSLQVVVGEKVFRGQIIGAVGMTGRATGPHLHYEVLVRGTAVNPATYLRD